MPARHEERRRHGLPISLRHTGGLAGALELAPADGAVVGDDLLERGQERRRVDLLALTYSDGTSGGVGVAAGDDALRVRDDRAVVQKDVDMVPGRLQGAD